MLRRGKITPSRAHAMSNITGKIMQAVKLSVETHKYVQKLDASASPVPLMEFAIKHRDALREAEESVQLPKKKVLVKK